MIIPLSRGQNPVRLDIEILLDILPFELGMLIETGQ